MRWIVTGLLLANVVFLLWNWLQYSHEREVLAMNVGVGEHLAEMPGATLVLLSESAGSAATAPAPAAPVSPAPAVETAKTAVASVNGELAPLVAPIEEIVSAEGTVQPAPAASSEVVPAAASDTNICVLLGPVADDAVAKMLLDRLVALQITAAHASVEVAAEPDYWVYLKPEATRELATVRLRELQEKKIDSFIIPQGEIVNGISLGVFDKKENAERRQQEVKGRGYEVLIRENPRVYREKWVALQPAEGAKFSPELYQQLRVDYPALDLRKEQCGKVASVGEFH